MKEQTGKICPDCDTWYEHHVTHCLVDGAELVEAPPITEDDEDEPPVVVVAAEQSGAVNTGIISTLLIILFFFSMIGLALFAFVITRSQGPEPTQPAPTPTVEKAEPSPQPSKPVEPPPEAAKPTHSSFRVVTVPEGAAVFEDDKRVCEASPCVVEHSFGTQTLPRTFTVRLPGHTEETLTVNSPDGYFQVQLNKAETSAPTPAGRRPKSGTKKKPTKKKPVKADPPKAKVPPEESKPETAKPAPKEEFGMDDVLDPFK